MHVFEFTPQNGDIRQKSANLDGTYQRCRTMGRSPEVRSRKGANMRRKRGTWSRCLLAVD
ncbi:unnamed protein product [Fusarium graminearum]|nr:unnamed protein product [Fusarium graminearum]VTO92714.1 unnamed protein product [Fusarium graminearum]